MSNLTPQQRKSVFELMTVLIDWWLYCLKTKRITSAEFRQRMNMLLIPAMEKAAQT